MIFVDESIQHQLGYICVAFVYCDKPLDKHISKCLLKAGLVPYSDEYKSGSYMAGNHKLHQLREHLAGIIQSFCRIGLYIAPIEERPKLLQEIIKVAQSITKVNSLLSPQVTFIDEGLLGEIPKEIYDLDVTTDCDSKKILGIQLADYVAYHCSYMLKCSLTNNYKKVRVETPFHPKSDEDVDLEWLIRIDLRRSFFMEARNIEEIQGDDIFFKIANYGSFFSPNLPKKLNDSALETFESLYMGCIL